MSVLVSDVLNRAAKTLLDHRFERWERPELIAWAADAALAIIERRPAAGTRTLTVTLQAGTLQVLPADCVQLMDVVRNVDASGAPGRIIRLTDRQSLDDENPDWHADPEADQVKQYTYDERLPTEFFVYPPVIAGTKVQLSAACVPAPVSEETDQLAINPIYRPAIVDYIVYRAMSKDDDAANIQKAAMHYSAFVDAIGGQNNVAEATSPNRASA